MTAMALESPVKSNRFVFQPDPANQPSLVDVPDVPELPRVLLIGDSISMGYTLPVRARLKGRANVHRPPDNCRFTAYGLDQLDKWLGAGKWAVIHFNFGLWDLKYLDEQGFDASPDKGRLIASPEEYERNLRELVKRLQRTGAKLIFATSTPVPSGTVTRVAGTEVLYNQVAVRVMRETGVAIDDLHSQVYPREAELLMPHNVHFTPEGDEELAKMVAASIQAALDRS